MTNIILIILGFIILGFIILYQVIKFKCTECKNTEVFVLKNEMPSNCLGGTDKRFNLLNNVPELTGDKVCIIKKDKYVFNKLIKKLLK